MKKTQPTILPPAPEILNERPQKMSFKAYKEQRSAMNKNLHSRFKGFLVHLANEIMLDEIGKPVAMRFHKGKTFVGKTTFLQLV